VRYENAERSLTPSGIVIRLRHDTQNWLTFKSPGEVVGGGIRSRFEAEVEVSDFDTMETILGQLGYYPYMIYEKYRTTYIVESPVGQAEVVLDEMPYGNFVEIEGEPTVIAMVVSYLDLHDAPRYSASYTTLFDYVRQHLRLSFQDLTFANFEGIAVPGSAFLPPHGS
jgi:adenylate cyclase, class 2